MLQKLHITNYAIIDNLEINFFNGFNIITGETGAGKSIILGALSLLLGERAEISILNNKDQKCIIEGIFEIANFTNDLINLFTQLEIEIDKEIIVRREIAVNGKSRTFINDNLVSLTQVKLISNLLVDLHQQFDNLALNDQHFQRNVIDSISGSTNDVEQFQKKYKEYSKLKKEIEIIQSKQNELNKAFDYNNFLYNELEAANLSKNEIENADEELKLLSNTENIKHILQQANNALINGDSPILATIKSISTSFKNIINYKAEIANLYERLNSVYIELDDITNETEKINSSLLFDAEKIESLQEKINVGYKLLKKHNLQTTDQLIQRKKELEKDILSSNNINKELEIKEKTLNELYQSLFTKANKIHDKRQNEAIPLAIKINELLIKIGMPNARIKIEINKSDLLNEFGNSKIDFLFDANKSNKFEPIKKVASGGELSRLMLSIKSLVAGVMQLPVLIFDEIDTGISGEAAKQVGFLLSNLAQKHQVICITHQPQIAAKATTHFYIQKNLLNNKIQTSLKVLSKEERITTIAKMLSGEKPTQAALENAKEMVMG